MISRFRPLSYQQAGKESYFRWQPPNSTEPSTRLCYNFEMAIKQTLMNTKKFSTGLAVVIAVWLLADSAFSQNLVESNKTTTQVSFNQHIRPILAVHCFPCHGPDDEQRQVDLRVDQRHSLIGAGVLSPGDADSSELIRRVESADADEVMPPTSVEHQLTRTQKQLLRQWVEQGAKYETHWAFAKPVAATPPEPATQELANWIQNPIDNFVLAKLIAAGLKPSPKADSYTLVRRLYLDLIGLPPTPEEADRFVNGNSKTIIKDTIAQLVNRPGYGERWARPWLDLARYADTNGYEKDRPRSIWPYRDWVIRALNSDLPYDQFSIHQLAGDMLPDATVDQKIATGFHRNTMLNEEGGIDPLEYRYLAMVDRVGTTGSVWLGMTIGCAQCHTHKFDPISHTDFFRMMALLNNADEPDLELPSDHPQRAKSLEKQIENLESQLSKKFPLGDSNNGANQTIEDHRMSHLKTELDQWYQSLLPKTAQWQTVTPTSLKSNLPRLEIQPDGSVFASGDVTKRDVYELTFDFRPGNAPIRAVRIEAMPDSRLPGGGPGMTYYEGRKGDFFVSEVTAVSADGPIRFRDASDSFDTTKTSGLNRVLDGDGSSGWQPKNNKATRLQLVLQLEQPITEPVQVTFKLLFERHYVVSLGKFRFSTTTKDKAVANQLPQSIEDLVANKERSQWSSQEQQAFLRQFLRTTPQLASARKEIDQLRTRLKRPHTMVMQERPDDHPRPTHRHHRGEYLNPRESVTPGIPNLFAQQTKTLPSNRLEFAKWLVSPDNPLAARVAVNRAWREFFGVGLVDTDADFGVQSPPPSHPELLDWLAVELQQSGWSMKHIHRLIVGSATYQQSSIASDSQQMADPKNRFLARGPRHRLTGETFRDVALAAAGLISRKMHGPGVRPPQPTSVTELAWGSGKWNPSKGEDRYRRSIYTFAKRTAPFAAYTVFDGPSGKNVSLVAIEATRPCKR